MGGMILLQPRPIPLAGADDTGKRLERGLTFLAVLSVLAVGLGIANMAARVKDRRGVQKLSR